MDKTTFRLTLWRGLFLALLALGLYVAVVRFAAGLGTSTNLSDSFPWGLWIGFDVLVGVGLAAGGFVIAATVHIFKMKDYEAIARPTILTAFLGYLLVIVGLLFDLGRSYRIWHPLIMWNPHSVMFEVAWCVMLYTTVLMLEFSPLVFERFGLHLPLRWVRTAYVPLVIAGVLLSTLHQSSLGTLYVIAPDKMHPLWYSPLLPVFFLISAIGAGLAMTIFESFMSERAFGKRLEPHLLQGLGRVIVVVLAVYAVWKAEDLLARGNFGYIFTVTTESVLFWGEMGLGVLLPMILFATPRIRQNEHGLFFAAVCTVVGFVINRLNVAITGMAASSGVTYIPSWMELVVTMTLVALGFAGFALAVKHLPVFPHEEVGPGAHALRFRAARRTHLQPATLALLWAFFGFGVGAVGYSIYRNGGPAPELEVTLAGAAAPAPVRADLALREFTFPASEASPGSVTFRHETHVDPAQPDCGRCHPGRFRITEPGVPAALELDEEAPFHTRCGSCHDGEAAFGLDEDCAICHQE